jgi:hypothetical protein
LIYWCKSIYYYASKSHATTPTVENIAQVALDSRPTKQNLSEAFRAQKLIKVIKPTLQDVKVQRAHLFACRRELVTSVIMSTESTTIAVDTSLQQPTEFRPLHGRLAKERVLRRIEARVLCRRRERERGKRITNLANRVQQPEKSPGGKRTRNNAAGTPLKSRGRNNQNRTKQNHTENSRKKDHLRWKKRTRHRRHPP